MVGRMDDDDDKGAGAGAAESDREAHGSPRLFIREMVMENFKSYAGEQHVGPFHKCFSAVVGPNGSGKSNVIDAMLFVFGKRAKQMRLNKVSELIHNSSNHKNLDKARVSVYFQEIVDLDDESYRAVPGSDFVVTRVAFRDNSSKYYIDNRVSSFTEVTKKLRTKGVDLDNNRFLILQGEVEQISLMKPKSQGLNDEGFLEYLEDIIGSNQHVEKIDESYKHLEVLNEKRTSIVQRVKMAEKEKENLEGAKNEAEVYMIKEAEIIQWRGKAAELGSEHANAKLTDLKMTITEQEVNVKLESEKLCAYAKEMKEMEAEYNKQNQQQEEIETNLRSCQEEFKEFERQDTKYREDLKHLKQKLKRLEDKTAKDTERAQEIEKQTEESTFLIPKLEEEIAMLSQQLSKEEEKLEKIKESSKSEIEKLRQELTVVRSDLEPWDKRIVESQGRIDVASSESKLLKQKHNAGRAAYEDALKQIEMINQKIKQKEEDQVTINSSLKEKQLTVKNARNEEQIGLKEQEVLSVKEQAVRQRMNELRSLLEAEKSQSSVLKAIHQAKDTDQIKGIYGRLGDLGAIDAKYDIAISTACPGLEYIVVETASAAQECVELLRTKGLGVATFLILDKQVGHMERMKQKATPPEGVPRLFDLVTVKDERLRLAFFSIMGNTVVAKDLEQASRIAYGSNKEFQRVVTLEGAVFEKSGTMSGGGAKPQGGRMGTAIRDSPVSGESVQDTEIELSNLTKQLAMLKDHISNAVQQYQKAEKTISHLQLDLAKNHMEEEGLRAQLMDLTQQLEALKAGAIPAKQELERLRALDETIEKEEKDLANLRRDSKELREKANELQKNIESLGGEKLKNQKAVVERLQAEIDSKSSEVNKRNVQITGGRKTLQKLQRTVEEAVKEKASLIEDKENKAKEFKQIEKHAFVVQEKFNKLQEVKEKQLRELESIKKQHNELKETINKLRTGEVDAQYKLDDAKKLYKDWETKLKMYQKKVQENKKELKQHIEQIQKEGLDPEKVKTLLDVENKFRSSNLQSAVETLALLEAQLKECRPQLDSIAEYRAKAALYDERVAELNAVTQEKDEMKRVYEDLRKKRLDEFMAGFNSISLKLKEMYQMITLGGDAELELVDSLDPFAEGVVFSVRPPRKSWKNIGNLSGGEKTLSSLALVFALHHFKPSPLYVMDEIDAALDFKNVSIVAHYIKDRTKDAQFIIISLRNNMFELADRLIGIYKTDNCTKSVTINPKSFAVSSDCSNTGEVEVA